MQGELRKKRGTLVEELATLESIEESGDLSSDQCVRKAWLISENLILMNQEELYWLNRCHENWLLKGDLNTNYFRKIANGIKRKNTILSLEKDGQIIEGDEHLLV